MSSTNFKDIDLYELLGTLPTANTQEVSEKHRMTEQDNSNLVQQFPDLQM
jgi:hypothetical protein